MDFPFQQTFLIINDYLRVPSRIGSLKWNDVALCSNGRRLCFGMALKGFGRDSYSTRSCRCQRMEENKPWVHGTSILGGMFGILQDTNLRKTLRREEFSEMIQKHSSSFDKGHDQSALSLVVAPRAANDTLAHDSYLCQSVFISGSITLPFPTQRLSEPNFTKPKNETPNFVGNTGNYAIDIECPEACRPKSHKDWKLC